MARNLSTSASSTMTTYPIGTTGAIGGSQLIDLGNGSYFNQGDGTLTTGSTGNYSNWNTFTTADFKNNHRDLWSSLRLMGNNEGIDWNSIQGEKEFIEFKLKNTITCIKAEAVVSNYLNDIVLSFREEESIKISEAIEEDESTKSFSDEINIVNSILSSLNLIDINGLYIPSLSYRKEIISYHKKLRPIFDYIKGGKENITIGVTLLSEIR